MRARTSTKEEEECNLGLGCARSLICHHPLVEGEKFPPAPEGCLAAIAASSPADGSGTARGAQGKVGSTAHCPQGEINGFQAVRSSLPFMGRWGQAERLAWALEAGAQPLASRGAPNQELWHVPRRPRLP